MANTKACSDEQIIAALLQHSTVKEAASAAGTTPRTIYDRMKNNEFQADYTRARAEIIRTALNAMNAKLTAAVDTIAEIMSNEEYAAADRLKAAQAIINNAEKFADRLTAEEKRAKDIENPLSWEL